MRPYRIIGLFPDLSMRIGEGKGRAGRNADAWRLWASSNIVKGLSREGCRRLFWFLRESSFIGEDGFWRWICD